MGRVVVKRISLKAVLRGKPTVARHRKAAIRRALWRVRRTPPGSESGAGMPRGNLGTGESHLSPCIIPGWGDRVTKGPGGTGELPSGAEPSGDHTNRTEAGKGSGNA